MRRALQVVRTRADAEDAVQEASVRALRYRASLRPGGGPPWFLRIVLRVSLDIAAGGRRSVAVAEAPGEGVAPPSEAAVLDRERSRTIRSALAGLPQAQRRAVMLHDVDGLTTRAIAAREGVPASTVRTRLRRGRTALRAALREEAAA